MLRTTAILSLLLFASCSVFKSSVPQPKEEFRAVWIATVANIDWPKNRGEPWPEQQQAYLKLLDFYKSLNFNTVIVQLRTAGDALYPTDKAPWSRYLSGTEGVAPDTDGDPLEWLINEAHSRGMHFHAWLNPYRATMSLDTTTLARTHDYYLHPDWMQAYGNRYYYNPGIPEVQDHLVAIVEEVALKYEVDGIHFDDYFYPYKIEGEVFADTLAYGRHAISGQSLDDWRRSNVDSLVRKTHRKIKAAKPWLQFGISPFGVWRNRDADPSGSDTRAGQTTYDDLYADPLLWLKEGWLDYIVPQLYWSMDFPAASHRKLLAWWAGNSGEAHLYIGNGAYKLRDNADKAWNKKKELPKQLALARDTKEVEGNVLFSAKSLMNHPDIVWHLRKKYYKYAALPPGPPGMGGQLAESPRLLEISEENGWYRLSLEDYSPSNWHYAILYTAKKAGQLDTNNPAQLTEKIYLNGRNNFTFGKLLVKGKKAIALTFLDAYGQESPPILLNLENLTL
jgi:uncharacterized lipoprotein YddW (UPF0748 family)